MAGQSWLTALNPATLLPCKWMKIVTVLILCKVFQQVHTQYYTEVVSNNETVGNVAGDDAAYLATTTEKEIVEDKTAFGNFNKGDFKEDDYYQFLPGVLAVSIILIFCLGARVAYSMDYDYHKSGSIIMLENSGVNRSQGPHIYIIKVDTGSWGRCGTSNHVRIEFHAKTYCSRVLCLQPNNIVKTILLRGHRDMFVLKTKDCLGEVLSLTLLILQNGKKVSWFLECIKLIDVSHKQEWNFPCYRWLSAADKTSIVVKLFPTVREPRFLAHRLQNGFLELHTWASLFNSYNRLGRLTRLERLALCCSLMIMQLFGHVATENISLGLYFPASSDEDYSEEIAKYVLIYLIIDILISVLAMIPEYFLRNSKPWGWEFFDLDKMNLDTSCLGCNPVGLPFQGDMAFSAEENVCLSPWHNTLECEICKQKAEEGRYKPEEHGLTPGAANILEPFMGEPVPKIVEENPHYNQAKLYEKAERYTHFFSCWDSFCSKFVDLSEDFKDCLDLHARSGKNQKLLHVVSWILDAMSEIQVQHHFKKKTSTPRVENVSPTKAKPRPCRLPAELLLPVSGCTNPHTKYISTEDHGVSRLGRAFAIVLLLTACSKMQQFKTVCVKTYSLLDSELLAILHRIVCTYLHAVQAFVKNEGQLCKISNGAITLYFNSTEEFLYDFLKNNEIDDYDFPECASITCHKHKSTPVVQPFSKVEAKIEKEKDPDSEDTEKKLISEEALLDIKTRIREYTQLIVKDIVKNLVLVIDARRPLHTLYDCIQYNTVSQEPEAWIKACVEFFTPLVNSVSCPLIKHGLYYLEVTPSPGIFNRIGTFLKTLVINAAMQASCEMSISRSSCEEWIQLQTFSQCQEIPSEDTNQAQYDVLVDLLKRCILKHNTASPESMFCSEGKLHLLDKNVLHAMLEEGRLRTAQLATPEVIKLLASLVEDMQPKIKQVQQFIAHALVTFTESLEQSADCTTNSLLTGLRQQLLDLNFLSQRLLQKSDHFTITKNETANNTIEPPAYWSMPGYHELQFMQKVTDFKDELMQQDEVPPLSQQEQINIQGVAFNIHKVFYSQTITLIVYFYLGIQATCLLPLILHLTIGWNSRKCIATAVALSISICLDVLFVQPIKVMAIVFGQDRAAIKQLKIKRPKIIKKKKEEEKPKAEEHTE